MQIRVGLNSNQDQVFLQVVEAVEDQRKTG